MNVGNNRMTNDGSTILVYCSITNERLRYIVEQVFESKATITNSVDEFNQFDGYKINYSDQQKKTASIETEQINAQSIQIIPHELLYEENIRVQSIVCFEWEGLTAFFKTSDNELLPFDFFAASFYLISRYEEYLPHTKDQFGRYEHTNSIAYQHHFIQFPLIQLWRKKIFEKIGYPLNDLTSSFSFIPTYDIDIAYSYRYHTIARNVIGFFKDLIKADANAIIERLQVLEAVQKDPYDIYEWLNLLHESLQLKPIYFFLVAAKRKGLDKNISPANQSMQHLIMQHAQQYSIGIHPSIQSNTQPSLLSSEIKKLSSIVSTKISHSRNHYIQIQLPQSFERLIEADIANDYSMGYPTINGFRASYSKPFRWFNLNTNLPTQLMIHPFCYMDATAIFHERITPQKAAEDLQYYFNTVKSVGGECIAIFHNNMLTNQIEFKPWRNVFVDFLLSNFTK